jgi:hypothetical protein
MADLIGKTIGQYEIVEKIGVGGMATVYKAYQSSINRYVAVKILPTQFVHDPNFVKRFTQEAKAIAALEHPHILPVYDFGTQEGLTYMVMRYIEGGTLADLMGQPMPNERIVGIVGNMAKALDYAHSQGVVHRDIKPSNILMDKHGEALLTDFGIAKVMQDTGGTKLTGAGSILGTPEYMSPEQAEGVSVDHRSDLYSLGVVLYELLTGQPPYQAKTPLAIVLMHAQEPLPPPHTVNPNVAEPLEQVVLKAMAKNRNQRYQTAAEMEQALKNALKEIESAAPTTSLPTPRTQGLAEPTPAPTPAKSGGAMGPLLIGGLIVAVLLCVGAIAIFALVAISGNGDEDTAVSGEVTVSGDLFQATEEIELTPTDIIFEERFDSDANGWATGEFEDEYSLDEISIEDGQYTLRVTAKEVSYIEKVLPNQEFSDFMLTLEATPRDADEHYSYGIAFRENLETHTYTFEIGNDGLYAIFLYDGEWRKLKDWSSAKAIKPGQTNELKIIAKGSTLTFFVNADELTTIEDDTLSEGKVGLILDMFEEGKSATVDFDNLVISRVAGP